MSNVAKYYRYAINRLRVAFVKRKGNIQLGRRIVLTKLPQIEISRRAALSIGDRTVLNSDNRNYHVNMFTRTKIFIEEDGIVKIGAQCRIHGSCIHARKKIVIGDRCLIAANCQIIDSNGHDLCLSPNGADPENRINTRGESNPIFIEDDVWLGTGVVVLPGVTIGRGSVITANSVVHKNIPPLSLAGGNPITLIRSKSVT